MGILRRLAAVCGVLRRPAASCGFQADPRKLAIGISAVPSHAEILPCSWRQVQMLKSTHCNFIT